MPGWYGCGVGPPAAVTVDVVVVLRVLVTTTVTGWSVTGTVFEVVTGNVTETVTGTATDTVVETVTVVATVTETVLGTVTGFVTETVTGTGTDTVVGAVMVAVTDTVVETVTERVVDTVTETVEGSTEELSNPSLVARQYDWLNGSSPSQDDDGFHRKKSAEETSKTCSMPLHVQGPSTSSHQTQELGVFGSMVNLGTAFLFSFHAAALWKENQRMTKRRDILLVCIMKLFR